MLNSQFNGNGATGLNLSGGSGQVNLDGVTADANHTLGASLINQTNSDLTILNSFFDNNGAGGLSANVIGGAITLNNVSASSNTNNGVTLLSFVTSGSNRPGIQETGGNFSGNGARGMQASSSGEIDITGGSFMSNTTDGLVVNGLNNSSAINLIGVQVGSNGSIGAQVFFAGDVQVVASIFTGNVKGGLDLDYSCTLPLPGGVTSDSFTITLDRVQALTNGNYGAQVNAGVSSDFPPVNLFITNSNFDQNTGTTQSGLVIDTFGSVYLNNASASMNAGNGADIISLDLFINNSVFNSNAGFGLVLNPGRDAALVNVKACFNGMGPINLVGGTPLFQNLDTACAASPTEGKHAPVPAEPAGQPWQTIMVFNQGTGRLSCQMGTTFIFLQKGTPPAADQELARAGLPAPLPDGAVFQGPAFNLALTEPGGGAANPSGALTLHFSLPGGFNLPAGKK
jgi:hypothetical protein